MSSKDCQEGGIVFGNWKLFPVDANNWELCHWHAVGDSYMARKAGVVGMARWNRLGRFYQQTTFSNALLYAADCELKYKTREQEMALLEAIDEYRAIIDVLKADLLASMKEAR